MAGVEKRGNQYCVVHDRTKAVLKRKGRRVCFASRGAAVAEAKATQRRIMGR